MKAMAAGGAGRIARQTFILISAGVLLAACGTQTTPGSPTPGGPGQTTTSAAPPATGTPSTGGSATPGGSATAAPPAGPTVPALRSGYLPLWPFSTGAAVAAWQRSYRTGGHQPWHLLADETALSFTRGYLGYTEVDRVTTRAGTGRERWIGVGWLNPNRQPVTVGTLHLLRYGTDADSPWEVVGSRDSTLTLTTPRYGSAVSSPMRVGGRITGVDESLAVVVHAPGSSAPAGEAAPLPAGGQRQPWSTTVSFTASRGSVLTIAVSTGGHLAGVESFAITGVRAAATSVATCRLVWGSGPRSGGGPSTAPLVNVRAGQHGCYDRIVFDVTGRSTGYLVRYVSQVTAVGSGSPLAVAGGARLQITVLAPTHDPVRLVTYYQPADPQHVVDVRGYRTFRQAVWGGSFEGRTVFGLGVRARLPFRAFTLAGPNGRTMVVVDVAHAW